MRLKLATCMAAGLALAMNGCSAVNPINLLDPSFVNALGLTPTVTGLPGDAPSLLVTVENRTDRFVIMSVSYRDGESNVKSFTQDLNPRSKAATAIPCVVSEVTLGDVANLKQVGALVLLGTSISNDPYISVEPFGVLLRDGANYDCGDSVMFTVELSSDTTSGFQTRAYIERSGSGQSTTTP